MPNHATELRLELSDWQARRLQRIDRLCHFLTIATAHAHTENNATGWWSRHVVWAIYRLDRLDYRFPECDDPPLTGPRTLADVTVIAA